ncbi:hypothetical protein SB761_36415, partial [Pseudomonas sp. SIMBA_064]
MELAGLVAVAALVALGTAVQVDLMEMEVPTGVILVLALVMAVTGLLAPDQAVLLVGMVLTALVVVLVILEQVRRVRA